MAKYTKGFPKLPERGWFKFGDKGGEVKKLQSFLNWANYGSIVASLKVDGEIGDLTRNAISYFQEIQHITIDGEFGSQCLNKAKALNMTGAIRAVNWAVSVSKDNRFTYGSGQRAHRSGCYFCQTNTGPRKKKKEKPGEPHYVKDSKGNKHTYEMTYCCNPFITAAYAHGAKDKVIHDICRSGSSCGMDPKDWTKSKNFKKVGTCKSVPFSKLKMGDVIISNSSKGGHFHHVWMYIGANKYVDASGGTWAANSIAVRHKAKSNYEKYYAKYSGTYVMRYEG